MSLIKREIDSKEKLAKIVEISDEL